MSAEQSQADIDRAPAVLGRGDELDREQWESLRKDAHNGRLWPAGDRLLQEIHRRHPEWRAEW